MANPPSSEWDLVTCEARNDKLERLEDAAVLRIEPRDEPLPADADEKEARRGGRACRAPARFRE